MAWKSVFDGAARAFFTPRQPSVSSILRTRMNHSTGGFEPLFPPIRSSGNVPPHMGFGLLKEAVVAAFRSLTVVSVGLLVADLIHGTEASHLREKVGKDLAELRTRIEVTELALEEMRTTVESLKTSRDLLIKSFLQQKELMQEFQAEQEKAMQDLKRRRD